MVQIIDTGGTIAGRIGKGFGKGLSEQLPKEVERTRLSEGLRNLSNQKFDPKNQLANLANIYAIPGMTPEIASLAQQQIAKQNFQGRSLPGKISPAQNKSASISENKPENQQIPAKTDEILSEKGKLARPESTFASPSEITSYKKSLLQEPSYEDKYNLANEYLNQGLTQNPQEALNMANQELTQNLTAQTQKNQALRTDLNNRVARVLQGTGLNDYKDISGEITQALIDQGEYMVNKQGMTPEQASEKLSDIALELGKSTNNLRETGSWTNMLRGSRKKTSELREQKKEFQKYGFGEQFDNLASHAMGTTPLLTAHILDPIKNKQMQEKIGALSNWKDWFADKKIKEPQLDEIVKSIKPEDNLFSIEYLLRNKGYDVQQFKDRVSALEAENEIALTPQQKRQQKRTIKQGVFGDILYESF